METASDEAQTRRDGDFEGSPASHAVTLASQGSDSGGRGSTVSRGSALGRYLVVDKLGAGGMGVVYRAFDPDLDRSVALKLVSVDHDGGSHSDDERARLLREAQAMARLSHPNVIPVFDVGILDDAVFVAMELVDGITLRQWLREGERTWSEIVAVFREAGQGLAAAHSADLIHRDFKPDNVMVGHDGRVRVLDFGLARATGGAPTTELIGDDLRASTRQSLERSMTVAGAVMGTPAYMAPEQHLGAQVDAAADQFALCVALFEALYGARPFRGDTLATLSLSVLQGKVTLPPGVRGKAPAWVLAVIQRGLLVDSDARYPSIPALLDALSHDPARRRRRMGIAVGALAVLGVGTVGGALLAGGAPPAPASAAGPPPVCTGAADAMASTWSDTRRDAIGTAFEASELAYAAKTWSATAARIDQTAQAWMDERTAACRATRVTGEQSAALMDLRMGCLDHQRRRLDALATALQDPDPEVIGRAFDAAHHLPTPAQCSDVQSLSALTPLPDDPEARERIETLGSGLDAVQAQSALGHPQAARERLEPLLPAVESLDFPPLSAQALELHASLQTDTGDVKDARETLERAYAAATAAGDARMAAGIAQALAFTIGYQLADTEQGLRWVALGRASVRHLGGDDALTARLHSAEGATLVAAGREDEALTAHGRAREYWHGHEPDGPDLAAVLNDIGAAHVRQGKIDEAIALHRQSLQLKTSSYGEGHPQVAASARELGNALSHAHRYSEALEQLELALAINRKARGERTQHVATLLDDIGRILRRQERLDDAIEHHRQALAIWTEVLGDPHPELAVSVLNVGYTLNAAGRFADALAEFERALSMFLATVGGQHPYVVYASNSVASAHIDLGHHELARPHLERVLAIEGLTVDPTLIAETKFMLTHALWADTPTATERTRARTLAREALASYRTQAERWGPQIEKIETWLAAHG
ncbi:MAG: serine/threonine-protein kinase [Deltaproteobacteria bacterium]|nr:serine/threonine-protein kinase [Deltaproteobacteria bacterium]